MNRFAAPLRSLLLVMLCMALTLGGGRQAAAGVPTVWLGGEICGSGEGVHGGGPNGAPGPMAPDGDHSCCFVCIAVHAPGNLAPAPSAYALPQRENGRASRQPLAKDTRRTNRDWTPHPARAPPAA